MAVFAGNKRIKMDYPLKKDKDEKIGCITEAKGDILRFMINNFSKGVKAKYAEVIELYINSTFYKRMAKGTKWLIDDNDNFFDEWECKTVINLAFSIPHSSRVQITHRRKHQSLYLMKSQRRKIRREGINKSLLEALPVSKRERSIGGNFSNILTIWNNTMFFMEITNR
jgi:hypothetical protein